MRPSPLSNPALQAREFGDDSRQPVRFYVFKDVIDELVFGAGYGDLPICAAALLGGFGVEENRGFVEVSGFIGMEWVAKEEDLYSALRPRMDEYFKSGTEEPIVGLFVAIPGCSGEVTEEVARVHLSLFNVPFQPILTLDPDVRALSLTTRAPRSQLFNAAFRAVGVRPSLNPLPDEDTKWSAGNDSEE